MEAEAPFLSALDDEGRNEALLALKSAASSGGRAKIRVIDPVTAVISLSGPHPLTIPAKRDASGAWKLSDTLTRRQTIDFIPAAE